MALDRKINLGNLRVKIREGLIVDEVTVTNNGSYARGREVSLGMRSVQFRINLERDPGDAVDPRDFVSEVITNVGKDIPLREDTNGFVLYDAYRTDVKEMRLQNNDYVRIKERYVVHFQFCKHSRIRRKKGDSKTL